MNDENVRKIALQFNAGDILISRLVDLDLNGHTASNIVYDTDEIGEVSVLNKGTSTTINKLTVTTPHATFNVDEGISINGETIVNNVAVGTFNTRAEHDGKVIVKDPDGGSINFTDATVNAGIEINPVIEASEAVIIRGNAPSVSASGNATVKILGNKPKVLLEGQAHDVSIEAPNSEFELSNDGDASKITIDEAAKGSKITTSKYYEFELLFNDGQAVSDITSSGLFGDKEIRVVGYPSELENIKEEYLLKLDGDKFSTVYTLRNTTLNEEDENVRLTLNGKLSIDVVTKEILFEGQVTGSELRDYVESLSQSIFEVDPDWHEHGRVVMSVYDVKAADVALIESDTVTDNKHVGMRVLVGTNEQHGLYILTKKQSE